MKISFASTPTRTFRSAGRSILTFATAAMSHRRVVKSAVFSIALLGAAGLSARAGEVAISDGKSFAGWEGDTNTFWHLRDGAFVGGMLEKTVPHNDFLCTTRSYTNFVLKLQFKLEGKSGFINGGVQFRSQRVPGFEVSGYQADMGDPAWWGSLYDESRRDKTLVKSNMEELNQHLKRGDWNDYKIRCEGNHIQIWINGYQTVDYHEADASIPNFGIIGLQIHGGAQALASYKDIWIEELP